MWTINPVVLLLNAKTNKLLIIQEARNASCTKFLQALQVYKTKTRNFLCKKIFT